MHGLCNHKFDMFWFNYLKIRNTGEFNESKKLIKYTLTIVLIANIINYLHTYFTNCLFLVFQINSIVSSIFISLSHKTNLYLFIFIVFLL